MSASFAHICEKWTMALSPPGAGEPWFLDWVLRSPKEAGQHLVAGMLAIRDLRKIYEPKDICDAVEYFGGMGAQAFMIEEAFGPLGTDAHRVLEYSPDAVDHLIYALRNKDDALFAMVRHADSYDPSSFWPADFVSLDFGDLTARWIVEGEQKRKLLNRVFAHRPKAVLLTDVGGHYLHLHKKTYEPILGEGSCESYPTYLDAFADKIEEIWGYTLVSGYYRRWSTVMALVPNGVAERGTFTRTPDEPVGIELF